MNCLRCGREAEENQSFCPSCLADTQKYPVRPGTPVVLPIRRETAPAKRAQKRKALSPEEQIRILKRRSRILAWVLAAALVIAGLLIYPTVRFFLDNQERPGQNYTIVLPSLPEMEIE